MTLLETRGIQKAFPGVHALRGVDLQVRSGEVLAIVGENGAGKSTLIKILAGALAPDAGSVQMDGREVRFHTPIAARRAGISVMYQELNLIPGLSACENIFLGRETTRAGFIRGTYQEREACDILQRLGVSIDPQTRCGRLSVAQQQAIEIAKALSSNTRVLVMDEPTAALTPAEVERLLAIVRDLKRQQLAVIYVSHRLEEVFAIADRILVLRDGSQVAMRPANQFTRHELIELMVGRKLEQEYPTRQARIGALCLRIQNLSRGSRVRNVSFAVRRGEVLGLAGLVGAGRTETVRCLFGADVPDSGTIELDGVALWIRSPRDAINAGIALLTEDRKAQGLVGGHSARENFGLPNLEHFTQWPFVLKTREGKAFARYINSLAIKLSNPEQTARTLSGGNQQKVVLAKWLERDCRVVIFDEPTRGIDVGARFEVYQLIDRLAVQGKAVIVVSSDFAEILGICERVLVMHEGAITGEITDVRQAGQADILNLAMGSRP